MSRAAAPQPRQDSPGAALARPGGSTRAAGDALASFAEDLEDGRYVVVDVLGMRAFVTFDRRQAQLATAVGLRVVLGPTLPRS